MELIIKKLPSKRKNPSDKERDIINHALVSYQIVLGQYEKYSDEMKRKDLEKLAKQKETNTLDAMNPFNVDMTEDKIYEPTIEDTKIFVYSSWAEAVANVLTPYICDGQKRKGIKRQVFRDVQNGKYLTNKVIDVMNGFINKLSESKTNNGNESN
jgi:hypothetical protein